MTEGNQESANSPGGTADFPQAGSFGDKPAQEAILRTISLSRFKPYLFHTGHNQGHALRLYMWNAQIGEAFHVPIQSIEVALRNRIWHHEPIFKRNLSEDYRAVMTTLEWICPATAIWVRPNCRVPALLREKP